VRTLQKAAFSVCGSGVYHYSRLRRLWSVRRQLRTGAPGLTVKASALAHGFWHQSEFSKAYRARPLASFHQPTAPDQARMAKGLVTETAIVGSVGTHRSITRPSRQDFTSRPARQ
jgi:transcriptional regulator GlxA family with amidase domain